MRPTRLRPGGLPPTRVEPRKADAPRTGGKTPRPASSFSTESAAPAPRTATLNPRTALERLEALLQKGTPTEKRAALEVALKLPELAKASPKLLRDVEAFRLAHPTDFPTVASPPDVRAARAGATLDLALQGWTAQADPPARLALKECATALTLHPALLEPRLSSVKGAAEALLLMTPARGEPAPALTAELLEAAEKRGGPAKASPALTAARERLIAGAVEEAERDLAKTSDPAALAKLWSGGERPLLRWVAERPQTVVLKSAPHLETMAKALHLMRFKDAPPRFDWEGRANLHDVMVDSHRVATDHTVYRARELSEVVEDLGPAFNARLDTMGPKDVLLSIGAREAVAERQFFERRGSGEGPKVVAMDVVPPQGEESTRFVEANRARGFTTLSGSYLEELDDRVMKSMCGPGGKVVVADNYAAMSYGFEPHLTLRALSFLPEGTELHTTLPFENRTIIEKGLGRSGWPEYFDAVKGFKVKSLVPNGDVFQVVLERTAEPFKAPVLDLLAQEPHGGPPGRRFRWTNDVVTQADHPTPKVSALWS